MRNLLFPIEPAYAGLRWEPFKREGGISLLHLSWGHPRRALPVILALWSPDFPHLGPFGSHPRLSAPVADLLYFMGRKKSNVLQILFRKDILYNMLTGAAQYNIHKLGIC